MGKDAWIEQLLAGAQQQASNFRKGRKLKKFCQWVERTTPIRTCSGIVLREGTIYCPYHTKLFGEMECEHQNENPG